MQSRFSLPYDEYDPLLDGEAAYGVCFKMPQANSRGPFAE
jgi:hypothetical protein